VNSLSCKHFYCNALWLARPIQGVFLRKIIDVVIIQTECGCYGIKESDITELKEIL
jgi:hypothetical protein